LGEVLDFSISFWPRHPAAWPAAFQVMFKNKAEFSLFELLCDVLGKNFQSSWFPMFISFTNAVSSVVSSFRCMASAIYT
jgi:hypothetical protein